MKELTILTVQGIGDILWVYQKLAPHVDVLHVKIAIVARDEVQVRGLPFMSLLPKIGRAECTLVSDTTYQRLARMKPHLISALGGEGEVEYAVNGWLEDAVRLEDIDPAAQLQRFVPLVGAPETVQCDDSLCVYMSGNKHSKAWDADDWRRFIMGWWERESFSKVTFVGARYDGWFAHEVARKLKVPSSFHVGETDVLDAVSIIRKSKLFLEYQSGLGCLAENYDCRMIHLVFPELVKMSYTWSKAKGPTHNYQEFLFTMTPEQVLSQAL